MRYRLRVGGLGNKVKNRLDQLHLEFARNYLIMQTAADRLSACSTTRIEVDLISLDVSPESLADANDHCFAKLSLCAIEDVAVPNFVISRNMQGVAVAGYQGLFSDLQPNQLARIMKGMQCAV